MNNCFLKNGSLAVLILFSIFYLFWIGGKWNSLVPAHFNLFILVISVSVALGLLGKKFENRRVWNWAVFFMVLGLLVYLIYYPRTVDRWLPNHFNSLVKIVVLLVTFYVLHRNVESREIMKFQYIILTYAFVIILSGTMEYAALKTLQPTSYITVKEHTVSFAYYALNTSLGSYLFFPLLYLLGTRLFASDYLVYKRTYLVPLIFIPSMAIAVYQGLVDIDFLNVPFFSILDRVSGLGSDANSFALTIYLLFPLTILSIFFFRAWWKKLAFFFLAGALCWCLLLSGSRTAFLGLTLFLFVLPWVWVWVNEKLSKRTRRVLVLLPFLFAISIGAIATVSFQMGISPSSTLAKRLLSSYYEFKEGGIRRVMEKSQRSHLWLQAYRLSVESPMSGWGPGGFMRNLDNTRFKYGENPRYTFLDNANNHYLQMSSELGLFGASFNLFLILFPLWMVFRVRKRIEDRKERWTVGVAFSTICIMMILFMTGPHTMALDVLWVFVLYLGFLAATGFRHGYSFGRFKIKWVSLVFLFLFGMFVLRTYDHTFGDSGYKALQKKTWWPFQYDRNCYGVEDSDGEKFRWCGKDAILRIPIKNGIPSEVVLKFLVRHPDISKKPVTFRYGGKRGPEHELVIHEGSWKTLEIPVTAEYLVSLDSPNRLSSLYFVVSLDVSRTWSPKKFDMSIDARELGVAVVLPDL